MQTPAGLPLMINVTGKRCVVVGAGSVGARRARSLAEAGARVIVIALQVHPSVRMAGLKVQERAFEPSDLDEALMVVVATDIPEINDMVAQAASDRGVLVNRADDAAKSDIMFMTSHRDGPLTVAVHSGGASASAAVRIRDLLTEHLDPDWARLLAIALPIRQQVQQMGLDAAKRASILARLSDDRALASLKEGGESALEALYADMMRDLA